MTGPTLLERALRPGALSAVFQPVVALNTPEGRCHYLEGLVRGPLGTNVESPEILFDYARRKHAEVELDRASLRAVLTAARAAGGGRVGVNVHTTTLAADLEVLPFISDVLAETGIRAEDLVVELVEHGRVEDHEMLALSLEGLRSIGVRVALDDFGTGQANYAMLLACRPDYLKIDRHFIQGCGSDPQRQAFLDSLATLSGRLGARLVAEGVEQPADLRRVRDAGIELAQGFLLGMPGPGAAWAGTARA
jgi:EAL domain-containing protein (putative c-di-GMP-specific phosphodiesterase class I)